MQDQDRTRFDLDLRKLPLVAGDWHDWRLGRYEVRYNNSRMRNAGCGLQDAGCRIQVTDRQGDFANCNTSPREKFAACLRDG